MKRRIAALLVAAALAVLVLSTLGQAATPKLVGEVGPGYAIEVTKAGKDVKKIRHGTYKIKVEDKASIHNFHLFGPGLNKKTGVSFQGHDDLDDQAQERQVHVPVRPACRERHEGLVPRYVTSSAAIWPSRMR